jgi:hypothetical protein
MNTDKHGLERADNALTRPAATRFYQIRAGRTGKFFIRVHPCVSVVKMKTVFIFAAVCLGLLAGCASHRQAEKSSGGHPQTFEGRDDFKIEMAVYGYLLEKHPWDNGEYTAIFLEGSDARVAAMIRKFPDHVPPIKPSSRAQLRPNHAPIDRDTGKPALILSAKSMDPTNDVSEAIGTWYAGEAASGLCAFVLMKVNGEWTIQSAK